jgi:hypothetical protein
VVDSPPPSFHNEYADAWGPWVLDHGLPALPAALGEDDEVPIALWAGERFGAVLFRSWDSWVDDDDLGFAGDIREVNDDHYCWYRSEGGWHPMGSGGGSGGPSAEPMTSRQVAPDLAAFGGEWQDGDRVSTVRGLTGHVGERARYIELVDRHAVTRRPVEAPLGQVLVCWDADDDVIVRILDFDERVLAEERRQPSQC